MLPSNEAPWGLLRGGAYLQTLISRWGLSQGFTVFHLTIHPTTLCICFISIHEFLRPPGLLPFKTSHQGCQSHLGPGGATKACYDITWLGRLRVPKKVQWLDNRDFKIYVSHQMFFAGVLKNGKNWGNQLFQCQLHVFFIRNPAQNLVLTVS